MENIKKFFSSKDSFYLQLLGTIVLASFEVGLTGRYEFYILGMIIFANAARFYLAIQSPQLARTNKFEAAEILNQVEILNYANIGYMVLVIFIPPFFEKMNWNQSFGKASYLLLLFGLSAYAFKCVQDLHQKLESVDAEEDGKQMKIEELTQELATTKDQLKSTQLENTTLIDSNQQQRTELGELTEKISETTEKVGELQENKRELSERVRVLSDNEKKLSEKVGELRENERRLSEKVSELSEKEKKVNEKYMRSSAKAQRWEKIREYLNTPILKHGRYYKFTFGEAGLDWIRCDSQGHKVA